MTALFVMDVQNETLRRYDGALLAAINQQIERAAARGDLILYVKNVRRLKGGKAVYEFADGLSIRSPHIVYKESASVFRDTAALELLANNGISTITIIGVDGNACVASSAIDARKLGYEVILPCRYIGVRNTGRFEKTKKALEALGIRLLP